MANHIRRQIREAFATQVTGLVTSGARVYQSRVRNLADTDLPALRIYTEQEEIADNLGTTYQSNPDLQNRIITLRCEALAKANTELDDTLDLMCKEVEIAIAANPTLGGLAKIQCWLLSTNISMEDGLEKPVGIATMTWKLVTLTMSNAPDVVV
jgi:hypothetical protein